mgnify:CR=1 FL=1
MQKSSLHFSSKIEIRKSEIQGFGVFAKEDIKKGEILEESPFVYFPSYLFSAKAIFQQLKQDDLLNHNQHLIDSIVKNCGLRDAEDYYFKWVPKYQPENQDISVTVLPFGFGPIYNTSNSSNNADWKIENDLFVFSASEDIPKDREILTFYGYFLDENGTKFECDDVYNLALDKLGGLVSFKSLRFGNLVSHLNAKNNPFFSQIINILNKCASPVRIKKISVFNESGAEQANIKIPTTVSLKDLFGKLKECKNSSFAKIEFVFEFLDKESSLIKEEKGIWLKM